MTLLNELLILRARKIKPPTGLCAAVSLGHRFQLKELFKKWPKFSGEAKFPVPGNKLWPDPVEMYCVSARLWDKRTAYGKLRHELLDFLITKLANQEM